MRVTDITKSDRDLLRAVATEYQGEARSAVAGRLRAIAKMLDSARVERSRLERAAIAFVDAEREQRRTAARFLEAGEAEDDGWHSTAIEQADRARKELDMARDADGADARCSAPGAETVTPSDVRPV